MMDSLKPLNEGNSARDDTWLEDAESNDEADFECEWHRATCDRQTPRAFTGVTRGGKPEGSSTKNKIWVFLAIVFVGVYVLDAKSYSSAAESESSLNTSNETSCSTVLYGSQFMVNTYGTYIIVQIKDSDRHDIQPIRFAGKSGQAFHAVYGYRATRISSSNG